MSEHFITAPLQCKMKICIICNYIFCHLKSFYFLLFSWMVDKKYWICSHTINSPLKLWVFTVHGLLWDCSVHVMHVSWQSCWDSVKEHRAWRQGQGQAWCDQLKQFQKWPCVEHSATGALLNGNFLGVWDTQLVGVGPLWQTRELLYCKCGVISIR